jgi:hypothetical protein
MATVCGAAAGLMAETVAQGAHGCAAEDAERPGDGRLAGSACGAVPAARPGQCAVQPPSITIEAPVTNDAGGEHR